MSRVNQLEGLLVQPLVEEYEKEIEKLNYWVTYENHKKLLRNMIVGLISILNEKGEHVQPQEALDMCKNALDSMNFQLYIKDGVGSILYHLINEIYDKFVESRKH